MKNNVKIIIYVLKYLDDIYIYSKIIMITKKKNFFCKIIYHMKNSITL